MIKKNIPINVNQIAVVVILKAFDGDVNSIKHQHTAMLTINGDFNVERMIPCKQSATSLPTDNRQHVSEHVLTLLTHSADKTTHTHILA